MGSRTRGGKCQQASRPTKAFEDLPIDWTEERIKVIPRLCLFGFLQLEE